MSIPENVFEGAERLAHRMKITRSRLYSIALASFVEDYRNQLLLENADAAFDAPSSSRDDDYFNRMKRYRRRTFKEERQPGRATCSGWTWALPPDLAGVTATPT